ncbi:MAG: hypothetical protein PVH29_10460 [Candidatus Zixiibacteriota bacterium]|jgi:hypothetical protein
MNLRAFITLCLCVAAVPAFGLVNFKAGYTSTLGELGERYDGGIGGMLELEIGLPGPVAIVPMGGYTQLGQDKEFTDVLNEYIEEYWPPLVPLPEELRDLGEINSSMYYFGAGVRAYAVENVAIKIHVEGGGGYYYRDMEAQGVPLSLIASFIPEFEEFEDAVEPETGFGLHVDFGLELFPVSPVAPQIGARYIHAFGIGRTKVDAFLEKNVRGFSAPESENVDLFLFYGGLGIF